MLFPRQKVPDLKIPTLAGKTFDLAADSPKNFTMVVIYRGLHCPVCQKYLGDLSKLKAEFDDRGVTTIVLSTDDQQRSKDMQTKVKGQELNWGYDLPLAAAKEWGLYISTSRGKTSLGIEEPDLFAEPGLFLVRPDNTLFYGAVQTMPFARPVFSELLGALDFSIANDYPARGEYTGAV